MDPTDGKVDRPREPGGFAPVGFRFERPYQLAEQPPPWVGAAAGLYDDGGRPAPAPAPGQAPEPEPAGAYAERRAVLEAATAAARGRLDAARAV